MQSLADSLTTVAAAKRDELLLGCANGNDDDLAVEDRPDRAEVSAGCLLKFGDDVELFGAQVVRYILPGRGVGWFYAMFIDDVVFQLTLGQFEAANVTDRIPADPQETPMPIFSEP